MLIYLRRSIVFLFSMSFVIVCMISLYIQYSHDRNTN